MQFEDLEAWQRSRELVGYVYRMFRETMLGKDFCLRDQMARAAISTMNNTAEGFERISLKDKTRFYDYARASAGEVRSMAYVALDAGYLNESQFQELKNRTIAVGKLVSGLMRSTQKRAANS